MLRGLLSNAYNADIGFDLHYDVRVALHMYALPQHWTLWRFLAANLNMHVGLLIEESGSGSFDEACPLPWLFLQRHIADVHIRSACMATLELGGQSDMARLEAQTYSKGTLDEEGLQEVRKVMSLKST